MFARILEFVPKMEKKDELVRVIKNEILPMLKKQAGFLEILPFVPEDHVEKMIFISLWTEKRHADIYAKDVFPRVEQTMRPYLASPISWKVYRVETTLCGHFVESLAA